MGPLTLNPPVQVRFTEADFRRLETHLFPGDADEHGAVLLCGTATTNRGSRLLVRGIILARDGIDYVPGQFGYRALTADFVARCSDRAASENLAYLAVHCHGGDSTVSFSGDDLRSHERGYAALLDITGGGPVGALVFAKNAVAGDIWTLNGRHDVAYAEIVGLHPTRLYPAPQTRPRHADRTHDRSARLYGDIGQERLQLAKVGIVGLGGVGSLLNEWITRLGVGSVVAIDPERLDITNLSRVVDATGRDALTWLQRSSTPWISALGRRFAKNKVDIGARVARRANPQIDYAAVMRDFVDEDAAQLLVDCDFIFLAADTFQCRLIFNAIVQQFLIPGVQAGSKVRVDRASNEIGEIHAASRLVLPGLDGGCLVCQGLIPPDALQAEAISPQERRAQRYVDDDTVVAPSVITLNAIAAAPIANDFMMIITGLLYDDVEPDSMLAFPRERRVYNATPRSKPECVWCTDTGSSAFARGDRRRLPTRQPRRN